MPEDPIRDSKESRSAERKRIRSAAASIYADGFASGMEQAASSYQVPDAVPRAGIAMPSKLEVRLDLVDDAVDSYVKMVSRKADSLRAAGVTGQQLEVELTTYARNLADNRGEIIAEMEHAQAKLDGAGRVLDEAGIAHEWRFPHFDLGRPHEECVICEAIRERAPYTQSEAEAEGFPSHPHPGCDHGWVIVPVGEDTLTEQFPPKDWWPRDVGGTPSSVPVKMPPRFKMTKKIKVGAR